MQMYSRFMQRDGRMVNGGKLGDFYQKAKSKRDLNIITLYDHDIGLEEHGVKLGFRLFLDLQPRVQQVAGPLSHLAPP